MPAIGAEIDGEILARRRTARKGEFCLSHRAFAKKVCVFDESCAVAGFARNLMKHRSAFAFEPTPVAKLMEFEVRAVEKIHIVVSDKSVRNERYSRIGKCLVAAVKSEIIDIRTIFAKRVDVLFSHLIGSDDKVYRAARSLFHDVDCVLNRAHADGRIDGFGVGLKEGIIASFETVDILAVAENRFA